MSEVVLEALESAASGRAAEPADVVDTVSARWVARPTNTAETAAVMKVAAEHGLSVVARGAGTKLTWGVPPSRVDLIVDTTAMNQVVEHAAGDLIAIAQAGCLLDDLQEQLGGSGQWLAADPARRGTIGGMVATAATGPARLLRGGVRDLIIGATMVRADGVVARSGGKVVKNVAGYDLAKLLTGSYGTLGIVTEAAFRLHPLPEARRWVSVPAATPGEANVLLQKAVHSQLVPSAVELDRPAGGTTTLCVALEGIAAGVEARTAQALDLFGTGATAHDDPPSWWGTEPFRPDEVALKVTHEIGRLEALLTDLDSVGAANGVLIDVRGSVAVGTVLVRAHGTEDPLALASVVEGLRERAHGFGGTVVVLDGPEELKKSVDSWGPVQGLELMRSVKHQFDPDHRLSPRRFVGGI